MTPDARLAPNDVQGLLQAAQVLLRQGGHLDALPLLHETIERAISGSAAGNFPSRYRSASEASHHHARVLSLLADRTHAEHSVGRFRELLRRKPVWLPRALTLVAVLTLTLRYVWASKHANWHQQNPEGDWVSRFYSNANFEGYPLVRYDVGVNYDFGPNGAADSMPKDGFSARWDTCLIVSRDVIVTLHLDSDDSSALWLDGVLQIEVAPGPGETTAEVVLHQGVRHLRVDLMERAGTAKVRLQGLELEGVEEYRFQRPVLEGNDVRCR